jgi:hypothetical protein
MVMGADSTQVAVKTVQYPSVFKVTVDLVNGKQCDVLRFDSFGKLFEVKVIISTRQPVWVVTVGTEKFLVGRPLGIKAISPRL